MSFNDLLLWLSAKREGSWSQFRAAVEQLQVQPKTVASADPDDQGERISGAVADLPIYQHARFALERLGHVEFYDRGAGNGWRVVPPTVALFTGAANEGVLCGARSSDLLDALRCSGDVDVLASEVEGMPSRILVRGPSKKAMDQWAGTRRLQVQPAAPVAILSAVPGVLDPCTWYPSPMPENPGWSIHRFSTSRLRWQEADQETAARDRVGFFRFVARHQRFYYLRWRARSFRVQVQAGKYAVLRRRRGLVLYDSGRCALSVPMVLRPPLLIERALVLCSGVLPDISPSLGRVEYRDVPVDVARLVAQLLRQEIR